ncbi:conserved hypothetical protein [Thiomonas arsenitoxydans]|uniref:Uncharacterized protein n=1 Tax=Thiomonas arsenitoxydans (strain DSM 22701 / CIP 110005 / 3As) TaxID=426114 RepID=D6CQS3_THIA3|nr:hypothetical protein [Thiomonas arsenitoxydans]CAZ86964.1 hypothetical protein THI_0210 [Thiomonas arsenitoxydans]CQR27855.1 conserved hypothetical protein [Thiomonas arsenitoxydans]CQR30195.1 conserved hypothetical protein [Thiomonas arsenitoxydans]CQR32178.1 conserved hypothetical protein [Thiomonas arsenitoxydans]CQR34210.1 conserved hypothetical protein [Thiomonas arsenitoxydans]
MDKPSDPLSTADALAAQGAQDLSALGQIAVEQIAALQPLEWRSDLAQISPWEYAQYAERF